MAKILQHRRGTTAQISLLLGAAGEIFVDTSLSTIAVHDGLTTGGMVLARASVTSVTIGLNAGLTNQGEFSVALGYQAGNSNQSSNAVAIGNSAGQTNQLEFGIAIGESAGNTNQSSGAISIGSSAGFTNQDTNAIAIGYIAGSQYQGNNAIAVGTRAGQNNQSSLSIAIGYLAAQNNQLTAAVAIGAYAGQNLQCANTIIINATGNILDSVTSNALYINPIRQLATETTGALLVYDAATKEVIAGAIPVVSGLTIIGTTTTGFSPLRVSGTVLGTNNNEGLVHIGKETLGFNDTDLIMTLTHNVNSYAQMILQNLNSSSAASADIVVNNNRTGGTAIYGDFGINSQNFTGASPYNDPDGTYLYAAGGTLTIGTLGAQNFKIATNDTLRLTIDSAGATTWTGNVTLVGALTATTVSAGAVNLPTTSNARVRTINYVIDGGGAAITTGSKGTIRVDFGGTITSWTVLADQSGSIAVDVYKGTYAVYGASGLSSTQTIVGTQKPTLTTSSKTTNITLTSWTTTVTAGDILEFNVDSASTVQNVTVSLKIIADN